MQLESHRWLHPEGQRLISTWFERAWARRADEEATFESFIFAWISVNAWASCVTSEDNDREYLRQLQQDAGLRERFVGLLDDDPEFRGLAEGFAAMWPIFKAQQLRRAGVLRDPALGRGELIASYLAAGMTEFEPECAHLHQARGELVPLDWPHTIAAIYRVRCNLFHGEKSAHSEMDRLIVRAAFSTLTGFFRGTGLL